jgi:hypothetical protein
VAREEPLEDRPQRAHRDEAGEQPDLGSPLRRLRRDEQRARDADEAANTIRATAPDGIVFGSVSMKNRKISTSGEVRIVRQKSTPQTGPNAQSAVMQCPTRRGQPIPTASVTQYVIASGSRWSRRVISVPPTMMIR